MLEGSDYHSLDKVFSFVDVFVNRSARYENKTAMARIHTPYGRAPADMTGENWQRTSDEDNLVAWKVQPSSL